MRTYLSKVLIYVLSVEKGNVTSLAFPPSYLYLFWLHKPQTFMKELGNFYTPLLFF